MKELIYSMQFRGTAAPVGGSPNVMRATTKAKSCAFTSVVKADGLRSILEPAEGGDASFESEVKLSEGGSFDETGTIEFGSGNVLHFSTVASGHLADSAIPKRKHGAVTWRIDRGEGQFEGATGLITSNFFITDEGQVTDNHLGVIFVP